MSGANRAEGCRTTSLGEEVGVENPNAVHSPHAVETSQLCMRQAIPSMARNSSTCVTRHYSIDTREAWVILSHTCGIRDIPWAITERTTYRYIENTALWTLIAH